MLEAMGEGFPQRLNGVSWHLSHVYLRAKWAQGELAPRPCALESGEGKDSGHLCHAHFGARWGQGARVPGACV